MSQFGSCHYPEIVWLVRLEVTGLSENVSFYKQPNGAINLPKKRKIFGTGIVRHLWESIIWTSYHSNHPFLWDRSFVYPGNVYPLQWNCSGLHLWIVHWRKYSPSMWKQGNFNNDSSVCNTVGRVVNRMLHSFTASGLNTLLSLFPVRNSCLENWTILLTYSIKFHT